MTSTSALGLASALGPAAHPATHLPPPTDNLGFPPLPLPLVFFPNHLGRGTRAPGPLSCPYRVPFLVLSNRFPCSPAGPTCFRNFSHPPPAVNPHAMQNRFRAFVRGAVGKAGPCRVSIFSVCSEWVCVCLSRISPPPPCPFPGPPVLPSNSLIVPSPFIFFCPSHIFFGFFHCVPLDRFFVPSCTSSFGFPRTFPPAGRPGLGPAGLVGKHDPGFFAGFRLDAPRDPCGAAFCCPSCLRYLRVRQSSPFPCQQCLRNPSRHGSRSLFPCLSQLRLRVSPGSLCLCSKKTPRIHAPRPGLRTHIERPARLEREGP